MLRTSSRRVLLFALTLFVGGSALAARPALAADYCAPLPPRASVVEHDQHEDTDEAGGVHWTSTVVYSLSTGQTAEAVLVFHSDQAGELSLAVDGEVMVLVRYDRAALAGASPGFTAASWASPELAEHQAMAAELLQETVGIMLLRGLVPQARKCSALGKGVMEGIKYLWIGATAAAGAACCAGTGILGCGVCATGAAAAGVAGVEAADGHCD